jgi:hypothetical protein
MHLTIYTYNFLHKYEAFVLFSEKLLSIVRTIRNTQYIPFLKTKFLMSKQEVSTVTIGL